eukprot:scaffold45735_cov19-Prasinocladus_malaysianus.AAC.1
MAVSRLEQSLDIIKIKGITEPRRWLLLATISLCNAALGANAKLFRQDVKMAKLNHRLPRGIL